MTEKAVDTKSHEYPMPRNGVNIHNSLQEIQETECLISKNLYWKNGMIKRGGQSLTTTNNTEVVAGKRIYGLHRFYSGSNVKWTVAAAGTNIKYDAGSNVWTDLGYTITENTQTYFTTWQGSLYVANGVDGDGTTGHMDAWDGTTPISLTAGSGFGTMSGKAQMYLPYQDRLLAIINQSGQGTLEWSASRDITGTWIAVGTTNVIMDTFLYGMINHSISNVDAGYEAGVLIAGADSMYLFKGTDLTSFSAGDYQLFTLAIPVGCSAPRTMCWTPRGTMWLGIDRQVYILPFDSMVPIPIGDKIRSTSVIQTGIESLPSGMIDDACAVYHDGFYKLSVAGKGSSVNGVQWWIDVTRPVQDETGLYGPWFGPMTGQTISCFANTNGPGDQGDLLGGEFGDGTTTKAYVYELHNRDNMGDITLTDASAKNIGTQLRTFYNPLGSLEFNKITHKMEMELLNVTNTVSVDLHDIAGAVIAGQTITVTASGNLWDGSILWDGSQTWGGLVPIREILNFSKAIQVRRLSVLITTNSSTVDFQLYALRVEAKEERLSYD